MLKLESLKNLWPYLPPDNAHSDIRSQWMKGLYRTPKYLILYLLSSTFHKGKKSKSSSFFDYEINVLKRNPNQYLIHQNFAHKIAQLNDKNECKVLNNKLLFWQFCEQNQIPTPKVLAYKMGRVQVKPNLDELFGLDNFFIKPIYGSRSVGVIEVKKLNDAYVFSDENRLIPALMMKEYFEYRWEKMVNVILQIGIQNHDVLAKKWGARPLIIRIISISKNKKMSLHRPVLYHYFNSEYLSPKLKGKHIYPVSLTNGEVGEKFTFSWNEEGPSLAGVHLPQWNVLKQEISNCHSLMPEISVIGWDVALTNEGPMIIEGNKSPWLDIHQKHPYEGFLITEKVNFIIDLIK